MLEAKQKRSFHALSGFAIIVLIYAALAVTAAFFYPKGFNPLTNTLTQLGDPEFNPAGAIFYNIGVFAICGMTVFIVIALLIAPKQWLTSRGATRKRLFYLTLTFMFLFALFYVITILVPSSVDYGFNSLFTLLFLACLELFIACSSIGIRRLKEYVPWIPPFGFAVAILNLLLVLASALTRFAIFSWITAFLSWSYMAAFIYEFSAATNQPSLKATSQIELATCDNRAFPVPSSREINQLPT